MVTQNKSSMPITYGFSRNGYLKRVLVILLGIEFLNIKTIQWNSRHMDSGNVWKNGIKHVARSPKTHHVIRKSNPFKIL